MDDGEMVISLYSLEEANWSRRRKTFHKNNSLIIAGIVYFQSNLHGVPLWYACNSPHGPYWPHAQFRNYPHRQVGKGPYLRGLFVA